MLGYHAPGNRLSPDGVDTTAYKNTRQRETRTILGYATKMAEERKLYADKTSERPVARIHGGRHTLVLSAVEDGGRPGAHAHFFMRTLAERAVRQGRNSCTPSRDLNGAIL